jgi:hypothetical protein
MTGAAVDAIIQFLRDQEGVECVLFRASPLQVQEMGYTAFDELRSIIGYIAKDFPPSIALDWF